MDNNNYYSVNFILIENGSKELWPGHRFWLCVHCDLELGNMTLATNHDTPCGHGQHMWKILSTSNMGLRSYGPDNVKYKRTDALSLWHQQ